ncbi:MAG: hypothetical protein O7D97_01815 [Planctomycetota bacterium]|nr:hypothetical protein [Planctomycetota bacterium]
MLHSRLLPIVLIALVSPAILLAAYVHADIIHVPGDYRTIQAAIDAAVNGDEVVVADGTYTGPGNRAISTGTKLITVRSAGGPRACVIDCETEDRAFVLSGGARVEGFTIRNGRAVFGGAMLVAGDATIVGCDFEGNAADAGGALYIQGSSPAIIGCTFRGNCAQVSDGGAVYNLYGNPALVNCVMNGNCAAAFGGGIFSDLAALSLVNCTISDNTAYLGGGITNYAGVEMTLSSCIIWGNHVAKGGGLEVQILSTSSVEVVNYSCVQDLDGAYGGVGNIDADPLFVDPDNGDYHISSGSPCIDAADNTAVPKGIVTDLDDNPRFVDDPATPDTGNADCVNPLVDMGAYEFLPFPSPPGDLNGDGVVGIIDLLMLLASWADCPALPEQCSADLNYDCVVDILDLLTLLANWG